MSQSSDDELRAAYERLPRVKSGALALERACSWATVKDYTAPEKGNQFACFEDGSNCDASKN